MRLTKTNFIQYLRCPKSLWLLLNEPDAYPTGETSAFLQKLIDEGYEVERVVAKYFAQAQGRTADLQRVFETSDGLYARADAFEVNADGQRILYEIKSSTRVKTDASHNHLKDACFQIICAERSGQAIDAVYLVYLNGNYVRAGDVRPEELLVFEDVTPRVRAIEADTAVEMDSALALLQQADIDRSGCSCLERSRAQHCDAFAFFNPDLPALSLYSLPRLRDTARARLLAAGLHDLRLIPDDHGLSAKQAALVRSAKAGAPNIDRAGVRRFLDALRFPLYFLDYETYSAAVPFLDGTRPHRHFVVQYSLHILRADGALEHREYLEREARLPDRLLDRLVTDLGLQGSVLSWHASFERTQNTEMARLFPERADFLDELNRRMVDLEDVFKDAYVDARFGGSTSIKKVLPVVCPDLSYEALDVQDGAAAMDAWRKMVDSTGETGDAIAQSLRGYCRLDTLAMVEIYRFLLGIDP
ncbi:MAG: DUF2779 domain-containing protein [Pseudomonadota bacterium]